MMISRRLTSGRDSRVAGIGNFINDRSTSRRGFSGAGIDASAANLRANPEANSMKWITREKAKVDRIACPWLIRKFVDPCAEFVFRPHDTDWSAVTDGTVFDVPGAELGHHGEFCSFDAIIARYGLEKDLALAELAKIVRTADT